MSLELFLALVALMFIGIVMSYFTLLLFMKQATKVALEMQKEVLSTFDDDDESFEDAMQQVPGLNPDDNIR